RGARVPQAEESRPRGGRDRPLVRGAPEGEIDPEGVSVAGTFEAVRSRARKIGDILRVTAGTPAREGILESSARFHRMPTPRGGTANMADLKGQVALVTGASRGVGRGVALGLAHAGATVFATGRTIKQNEPGEGIHSIACDHTDDRAVEAVFRHVEASA